MADYKKLVLEALTRSGWELVERSSESPWWLEEWWKIRSTRQAHGYDLFVLFLVEPGHDGPPAEPPPLRALVEEVAVLSTVPAERPGNAEWIASLCMRKGEFSAKLAAFVAILDQHRSSLGTKSGVEAPLSGGRIIGIIEVCVGISIALVRAIGRLLFHR